MFQIGTSIMYIGLTLTYASSFQMFRGSIIVFVALLSVIFLEKQIIRREYVGIGKNVYYLHIFFINRSLLGINTLQGSNESFMNDLLMSKTYSTWVIEYVFCERSFSAIKD